MRRAVSLVAAAVAWGSASCALAQTNIYLAETDEVTRILVSDPFSPPAMRTLVSINQAQGRFGAGGSPILSIDNLLDRQTFEDPSYGTSFMIRRTITFDLGMLIAQADAALEPYRRNGCSKFRISSPEVVAVERHAVLLRVNMSFKKRACGGLLGTHDIATGHGYALLSARLVSVDDRPDFVVKADTVRMETDSVLGLDPDSLFGRITQVLTADLARLMGRLNPGGTLGDLQFRLLEPVTGLARSETIAVAQEEYSPTQISAMVRGLGSLSAVLGNPSARVLKFSLDDSEIVRQRVYALRPEFADQKDPTLCTTMGPGGLNGRYCTPTPSTRLVLRIVQRTSRVEEARQLMIRYYTTEAVYLGSLSRETEVLYYPSHVPLARIVDEHYLSQRFRPFFLQQNSNPECTRETSPGRPRTAGEMICAYNIVPAWRRLNALPGAVGVDG